jgi:hypothetical protein
MLKPRLAERVDRLAPEPTPLLRHQVEADSATHQGRRYRAAWDTMRPAMQPGTEARRRLTTEMRTMCASRAVGLEAGPRGRAAVRAVTTACAMPCHACLDRESCARQPTSSRGPAGPHQLHQHARNLASRFPSPRLHGTHPPSPADQRPSGIARASDRRRAGGTRRTLCVLECTSATHEPSAHTSVNLSASPANE